MWTWATLHRFTDLATFWRVQRLGLSLSALGWVSLAGTSAIHMPDDVVSWALSLAMGVVTVGLYVLSLRTEAAKRATVGRLSGGPCA